MEARILDGDKLRITRDPKEIHDALTSKLMIWVELEQKDHACDVMLSQQLNLHPLTIEDIWSERSQPKLEEYDRYLYIIFHGIAAAKGAKPTLHELDIVIGDHWVITYDTGHLADPVRDELARTPKQLDKGPAWLAHAILDTAVDRYLPIIDQLDGRIETLENEVLRKAGTPQGPPILKRILRFKRMLLKLRRMSVHQREILLRLARGELSLIPREMLPFFRDIYDHFLRVSDLVESYRDLVTSALEAYLSVQSNRMNEIMKTLTLISTVMLPITFIAGLYGMNFKHMPELDWYYGYPMALGIMGVIVVVSLVYFKRKGWIGRAEVVPEDRDVDDEKDADEE